MERYSKIENKIISENDLEKMSQLLDDDWIIIRLDSNKVKVKYINHVKLYNCLNPRGISKTELLLSKDELFYVITTTSLWPDSLIKITKENNSKIISMIKGKYEEHLTGTSKFYYELFSGTQRDSLNEFKSSKIWNKKELKMMEQFVNIPTMNISNRSIFIERNVDNRLCAYPLEIQEEEVKFLSALKKQFQ